MNWIGSHLATNGLPRWCSSKESACQAGVMRDAGLIPGLGRYPREGNGNPLQYSCLENLAGYSPQGHKASDTTEHQH